MSQGDSIVACASPPGRSPRALVRLSGPHAATARARLLVDEANAPCSLAAFRLSETAVLPVITLHYRAPSSFTGEEVLELIIPGNPALVERVLARLGAIPGVRPARPGEFSARAYLNGRLSLAQAEAIAALIAAENDDEIRAADELRRGDTLARYESLRESIATTLALVEAGIDFTDQEDVVAITPEALRESLDAMRAHAATLLGASDPAARHDLPRVALVGEPNAGKSTLFNTLLGRRRAVASPLAGTTRDVLEEELDLSGERPGAGRVLLADLPGLEAAPDSAVGRLAQAAARAWIERADLLVWCDPRGIFPTTDKACVRVRTRADQPGHDADADVCVSAIDGYHLAKLRALIGERAYRGRAGGIAALVPRHRFALERMIDAIVEAKVSAARASAPELVAAHLRLALDHAGELAGRLTPDEVLGRIFARFCIGK